MNVRITECGDAGNLRSCDTRCLEDQHGLEYSVELCYARRHDCDGSTLQAAVYFGSMQNRILIRDEVILSERPRDSNYLVSDADGSLCGERNATDQENYFG